MQRNTLGYAVLFATAICVVCAVIVSSSAVALKPRQDRNADLERKKNVLLAAGLATEGEPLSPDEIEARFGAVDAVAVDLKTGEEDPEFDLARYDQNKALSDPDASYAAPPNAAKVTRLPNRAVVYQLRDDAGNLDMLVLPVEGMGLWSTLYGFLALDTDLNTIRGITFYKHGETAGLGGEVDNPRWKALWLDRKAFDEYGEPAIAVIRGRAGPPAEDPHNVDGISGATLTGRGVGEFLRFWLGDAGFGPYLDRLRGEDA
jgi:Na+-transporting NADH:ubiquinone oxidoreductase subunit C